MQIKEFLNAACEQIKYKPIRNCISEELENHIEESKVKESNGKLLIIGMSSIFILQSIFNILMNLNLIIDANFNLPFVSYGRLNLIVNMMCLTLVLAIYRRKDILILMSNLYIKKISM